jgi:hypothetical protein
MAGADCATDCSGQDKKKEVAADYSGCVCPGTKDGAKFADANACDACDTNYYPAKDCKNKCDDSKLYFIIADGSCSQCKETEYFKTDNKTCTACTAGKVPTKNGKDCECPNSNFADNTACDSTDACKPGYVPKGKCDTKCSGTQYIDADACKECSGADKGRISKGDFSGCECTADDAKVTTTAGSEDCSCKDAKTLGVETVAYK